MDIKPTKSWWLLGVGVLLGAGAAYAADARYDTANESIDRATTLLNAIGAGTEKPASAFQRKRALKALERAKIRIACAKETQDSTKRGCLKARQDRFDDNDDDRDDDHADHDHGHGDHGPKGKAEKEKAEKEKKEKAEKEKAEKEKKEKEKAEKEKAAQKK